MMLFFTVNIKIIGYNVFSKNAKDASLYLKIDKYNNNEEMNQKSTLPYIEEEFSLILSSDINYSKEMDYMKAGSEANQKAAFNPNDDAKDKYREIIVGLLSKACIDANKVVANKI